MPVDIVGGSIDNGGNYCCGDVDHDGVTGIVDLLESLADWGRCPPEPEPCPADFDDDDIVGISDFELLLANWRGPCPLFP